MEPATFERFRDVVYDLSGIALGEKKQALLAARLGKRMRALGIGDYEEYLLRLEEDETGEELRSLLDAVSTNVTSFFREANHFDFIRQEMSEWLASGQRRFRFWSAACSTGEEPLSLAMTLLDACLGLDVDIRILATDISGRALGRCAEATYPAERVASVPEELRRRWMTPVRTADGVVYRPRQQVLDLITYRRLNLSVPPFPMTGPFDAVLCRNVMIYFDNAVRARLLDEVHRLVKPRGYLFVGHAESLTGMMSDFRVVRPSVYVRA
jgi:chemotaxis protein methyltransferase CheR